MSIESADNDIISIARTRLATILQAAWTQISTIINNNLPPETREHLKQKLVIFARSRPVLATLLLSQLAFSGIPLLFFVLLVAGIFVFSLIATLIFGILGALMVTLFCMGLGSLVLIPVLFATTLTAGGIWLWGWGLYHVVQWVGCGDTALLTRLTLLLVPQRLEKSDGGNAKGNGYGGQDDEKSEERLDVKVSTESNGHSADPTNERQDSRVIGARVSSNRSIVSQS